MVADACDFSAVILCAFVVVQKAGLHARDLREQRVDAVELAVGCHLNDSCTKVVELASSQINGCPKRGVGTSRRSDLPTIRGC